MTWELFGALSTGEQVVYIMVVVGFFAWLRSL